MKPFSTLILFLLLLNTVFSQVPADSVTITFRSHEPVSTTMFIPGEFTNWGQPYTNGYLSQNSAALMTYNSGLNAWTKTLTFKIYDPSDSRRTFNASAFQYKFNRGGTPGGWISDPLNKETNPANNNNSVLRLSSLFWYQYYPTEVNSQVVRITVGLVHANSDSIAKITLSSGATAQSTLIVTTVTEKFDRANRILDIQLSTSLKKLDYLRLAAYNHKGDSVIIEQGGFSVISMPLPPNVQHGVNLPTPARGDSTTFRLRLKGKQYILLKVAPIGQTLTTVEPIVMRRSPTTDDWWTNVKLAPGTYEYLYELENGSRIYDPWGKENGDKGSRFTIGPEGLTADDYNWKSTAYKRPPLNKIVIYEMHIGEFTGGYYGYTGGKGTFRDLITLLPYLDSLGVNAIELMPVNDYGSVGKSGHSWGYDINSYFALEPAYGTPRDFKALIDAAHAKGIAIILDVVFNHLNETSPLWQMDPDDTKNPYFKPFGVLRSNEDALYFFKDLDHWSIQTQELISEVLKMWIDTYRVDGFRYDFTQGIGWDVNDTTKGILGWANMIHQRYNGTVYQIAEHLPESPALIKFSGLTGGWHDSFHDIIFDAARNQPKYLHEFLNTVIGLGGFQGNDIPSQPSQYASRTEPVNYTVSHDEQSLIYEMNTFQNISIEEAVKRDKLYGGLMFTSLGIPMVWQGVEISAARGWRNDGEKLSYRPLEWVNLSTPRGKSHFEYYRALIRHRRFNPALTDGEFKLLKSFEAAKSLVWGFEDLPTNSRIVVAANFTSVDQTLSAVPWLAKGIWYDVFTESTINVSDTLLTSFTIPAYSMLVYSNRKTSSLVTQVSDKLESPLQQPLEFHLEQNFPNPFNPTTEIAFTLPGNDDVKIEIFNSLGERVRLLIHQDYSAGNHSIHWDGRNDTQQSVPSGLYITRFTTPNYSRSMKMVLIK
ncbi:MAG: alpha-amylase family glycosyl hydrolase [bacterium]